MPVLTFDSLRDAQRTTNLEFVPRLAARHHYVQLTGGRWYRTLGVPESATKGLIHVRGNVWKHPPKSRFEQEAAKICADLEE